MPARAPKIDDEPVSHVRLVVLQPERPKTRADCVGGERPCPFVSCRHHLALDIHENGALAMAFPGVEISDMAETCALDVADHGGLFADDVGALLNVTRQRVQQIEARALAKLAKGKHRVLLRGLAENVGRNVDSAELWAEVADWTWQRPAPELVVEEVADADAAYCDWAFDVYVRGGGGPVASVEGPADFGRGITIIGERCDEGAYPRDARGELVWDEADGIEWRIGGRDGE